MADSYFKKFQQIYYITRVGSEEQLKVLTDITTNVRLRKKILQNITAYEFYNLKQFETIENLAEKLYGCLLYTSPSPRDATLSRMPSSA